MSVARHGVGRGVRRCSAGLDGLRAHGEGEASALLQLAAPLIPQVYNTSNEVRALATSLLRIYAFCMPLFSFCNSAYFILRSGGKTLITFLFDSGSVWLLSIPAAFLLAYRTQVPIVPMFAIVEGLNILKCAVGYLMVRRRRWVVNLVGRQA